jgi:hypothetical protein
VHFNSGKCPRLSTHVAECSADVLRIHDRLRFQHRRVRPREESNLQRLALNERHHPLRVFAAAERVAMQELLRAVDVQPVKISAASRVQRRIEYRADFGSLQTANMCQRKREEVNHKLRVRYSNIPGDRVRSITHWVPSPLILRRTQKRTNQQQQRNRRHQSYLHPLSMTPPQAQQQPTGRLRWERTNQQPPIATARRKG